MLLLFISVVWGRSDSARSWFQWDNYVGLSHCQRSLERCLQRNTFDRIWWFIPSKWVTSWFYWILQPFYYSTRQAKASTSVLYGFWVHTWSFDKQFEFHSFQIHQWNLIENLAITLCINVSIWNYKFCCHITRFSKAIKQHVLLTPTYQKQSLHSTSRPRSALKRNPPSWCWNILIGRNVNFVRTQLAEFNFLKISTNWLNQTARRNTLIYIGKPQTCN